MRTIWTLIDLQPWKAGAKYRTLILIASIVCALAGCAVWLLIRPWFLSAVDWMICLIGYPVVVSWIAVFFYSTDHRFHNGTIRLPAEGK